MQSRSIFEACMATFILLCVVLAIIGSPLLAAVILRPIQKTEYPLLALASGSMVPALNVGDLIVVQGGLTAEDIVADYVTGDVIVFYRPGGATDLIVHRAVEKEENGETFFKTKGDHNPSTDYWGVYESDIVGKVTGVIPNLGKLYLFLQKPLGFVMLIALGTATVGFGAVTVVLYIMRKQETGKREGRVLESTETQPSPVGIYCQYCGAANKGDAVFCQTCGKNLS